MNKKTKLFLPAVLIMALWTTGDAKKEKDPFYESFYEKARLIMTKVETDIYDHLTDKEEKEAFIEDFWKMRDPYPDTAENEFKVEFDRRIAVANPPGPAPTITTSYSMASRGPCWARISCGDMVSVLTRGRLT